MYKTYYSVERRGDVQVPTLYFHTFHLSWQNGLTALHLATLAGHNDFVASILNDGADVNATDGQGR